MNPRLEVAISARYNKGPAFDQLITDAQRANAALAVSGNASEAAMSGAAFQTANLAAQFNDIGVMLASGQSPLILAVQQGTQIAQVLGPMKAGAAVAALKTAFMSLISPVSLVTIGSIAAGAAVVQWAMRTVSGADDGTQALEDHEQMLSRVLRGYSDLRQVADDAFDAVMRLPEGVVASDLTASLQAQEDAIAGVVAKADELRQRFAAAARIAQAQGLDPSIVGQIETLSELNLSVSMTREEFDAASVAARDLFNTARDPVVKQWASEFYELTDQMRRLGAETESTDAALRNLPRDVQIRIRMRQEMTSALDDMQGLFIDPRDRFTIMREQLENAAAQATATAQTYSELIGIGNEFKRVQESIDAAEQNELSRRAEATGGTSPSTDRSEELSAFQRVIESLQQESELVGITAREREVMINLRSAEVGAASDQGQAIRNLTLALYDEQEATKLAAEQMQFFEDISKSAASTFVTDILAGRDAVDALSNSLNNIGQRLLNAGLDGLFSGLFSGFGSAGGGLFPGLKSPLFMATGGFVAGPGTSTSDSVPAMLSRGEYVVNADAAARFGWLLEMINNHERVERFANGGWPGGEGSGELLMRVAA